MGKLANRQAHELASYRVIKLTSEPGKRCRRRVGTWPGGPGDAGVLTAAGTKGAGRRRSAAEPAGLRGKLARAVTQPSSVTAGRPAPPPGHDDWAPGATATDLRYRHRRPVVGAAPAGRAAQRRVDASLTLTLQREALALVRVLRFAAVPPIVPVFVPAASQLRESACKLGYGKKLAQSPSLSAKMPDDALRARAHGLHVCQGIATLAFMALPPNSSAESLRQASR